MSRLLLLISLILLLSLITIYGQDGTSKVIGDEVDGDGDTMIVSLLLEAAREGDINTIREEIAKGADILVNKFIIILVY